MRRPRLIHVTTVDLSLAVLLLHQLERFEQEGFDVTGASAPGPFVANLEAAGITHTPVESLSRRWEPIRDQKALRELVSLFRSQRPDIVHTHNPKSGVLGRVAARIARVPVVVNTVHGLYTNPALPPFRRTLIGASERGAAKLSSHEFFQSAEDYDYALRTRMVRSSRASVLGNGVDLARFDPARLTKKSVADQRKEWRATPSKVVIGTVGRLVFEKGFAEFFAAVREIRRTHKNVVPVVVGPEEPTKDDGLSAADIARARAEGIVFHGPGTADDMPALYAAFDIFVLASHREGMPRSAIEASAMARPIVATNIRGCREVVADGETGLLVPARSPRALAAAIDRLVKDAPLRQQLGEAGRRRAAERFDEEFVVERTLTVYRRLLAEHGSLRP